MLKNEEIDGTSILPLTHSPASIAVIGRLATAENMGDSGSSMVRPPSHVTPLEGIRAAYPKAKIIHVCEDDPKAAAKAAAEAEIAIIVAGFTKHDEGEWVGGDTMDDPILTALYPELPEGSEIPTGEANVIMTAGYGGDRSHLALRDIDEEIILAVADANPRTIVALVGAGTIMMERWRKQVPAILMLWYAGMEGGHAFADVLRGSVNPSGRLPFSIPTSEEHLPAFDRDATTVTYDRWHGQRLLDRLGVKAAYPLGWGLSYTSYRLDTAEIIGSVGQGADRILTMHVKVSNTGERDGIQVVQVYGRGGRHAEESQLLGFATVEVPAASSANASIPVRLTQLGSWDRNVGAIVLEDGEIELEVAFHAHDEQAIRLLISK
nr:glycoside hydrolase family 3 C-terminal domain-containing protein [Schaalia vaccimaxillae]